MPTESSAASLAYHEPSIVVILVQASFLLLLSIANAALDRTLCCGLLGQVLVGIAWGAPGARWLSASAQETIAQLGYLGLILLVYEGGLHTWYQPLKANLMLSTGVALTGIALPIALSYSLQGLLGATSLQAFAAGAALCSTSLGTVFTLLSSSGLSASRLGVVLTSAAMMDDVVGLVMVQVISNLGSDSFSWVVVVRPVLASIAFTVVVSMTCRFAVKPMTALINTHREANPTAIVNVLLQKRQTAFTFHAALLIGLVAGATYAGTSNLFAAYVAGAAISWWDSEVPHASVRPTAPRVARGAEATSNDSTTVPQVSLQAETAVEGSPSSREQGGIAAPSLPQLSSVPKLEGKMSGAVVYQHYFHPAVAKILQPFFFASVGFSIPITLMFRGAVVWRGVVYASVMAFAKLVCGLWLVRFSSPAQSVVGRVLSKSKLSPLPHAWGRSKQAQSQREGPANASEAAAHTPYTDPRSAPNPAKPVSLHPPLILALAMCARGEIGFLISGVAESSGIFSRHEPASGGPSDIYLIVTWALVLCTVVGPLGVGLSIRRIRRLQERKDAQQEAPGRDVLGVWGFG